MSESVPVKRNRDSVLKPLQPFAGSDLSDGVERSMEMNLEIGGKSTGRTCIGREEQFVVFAAACSGSGIASCGNGKQIDRDLCPYSGAVEYMI